MSTWYATDVNDTLTLNMGSITMYIFWGSLNIPTVLTQKYSHSTPVIRWQCPWLNKEFETYDFNRPLPNAKPEKM
jgi:hypothetical protein